MSEAEIMHRIRQLIRSGYGAEDIPVIMLRQHGVEVSERRVRIHMGLRDR